MKGNDCMEKKDYIYTNTKLTHDKKYSRMLKEKFPTNNGEFVKFSYIVVPEF